MTVKAFLGLALIALPAYAQDHPAARSLAATCAACHGPEGRSTAKEMVSLAGCRGIRSLRRCAPSATVRARRR